ncbi:MAG: phosphotransferase [Alphaproteobacteria bacterium]|jgi:thiamine kinase-like enzyme|nr:phosphotransferase [Alphaproteobacteria bacterium]MBP7729443.1 phosphotransferase [Alphaproteobacteria bacterium]
MSITVLIDPLILQEGIDILSEKFKKPLKIKSVVQLSELERRNSLLRIYLQNPEKRMPNSLIFKQTCVEPSETEKDAFARFVRDWAGLEFLSQVKAKKLLAPRFYGGSIKYRFVLLEDLGEQHISLVDSLTGDNEPQAKAALHRFMKCLGQFHATGYGKTEAYFEILKKLTSEASSWQEDLKIIFDDPFPKLKSVLKTFGISPSESLWAEINMVLKASLEPGPFTTFIHGDNCPDNVFDNPGKNELLLIDFEWGSVRSALLDGTYLRMSMPTCWCSKAIPENLISSLEATYRAELMKKIPAANDDETYHTAYTQACAFWMLTIFVEIEKVMDEDRLYNSGPVPEKGVWKAEENSGRPRTLSRLQAFINVSKKYDKLPHLKSIATQVLRELKTRWPDAKPLDLYPTFHQRGQ